MRVTSAAFISLGAENDIASLMQASRLTVPLRYTNAYASVNAEALISDDDASRTPFRDISADELIYAYASPGFAAMNTFASEYYMSASLLMLMMLGPYGWIFWHDDGFATRRHLLLFHDEGLPHIRKADYIPGWHSFASRDEYFRNHHDFDARGFGAQIDKHVAYARRMKQQFRLFLSFDIVHYYIELVLAISINGTYLSGFWIFLLSKFKYAAT